MTGVIHLLVVGKHENIEDDLLAFLNTASDLGWNLPRFDISGFSDHSFSGATVTRDDLNCILWIANPSDFEDPEKLAALEKWSLTIPIVAVLPDKSPGITSSLEKLAPKKVFFKQEINGPLLAHALVDAVNAGKTPRPLHQSNKEIRKATRPISMEHFRNYAHHAEDLVLVHNQEEKILYINPAFLNISGYSWQDSEEKYLVDLFPDSSLEVLREKIQKTREGETSQYNFELELSSGSGADRSIESSLIPLDFEGDIQSYLLFGRDISSRREVENALLERTRRLEALRSLEMALSSDLILEDILKSVVSQAVDLVEATAGGISLYQENTNHLFFSVHTTSQELPENLVFKKGEGLAGKIWETGQSYIIDDYLAWENRSDQWIDLLKNSSVAGVPVRWGKEFLGVLEVMRENGPPFSEADLHQLELYSPQAAIAIHNATLVEALNSRIAEFRAIQRASLELTSNLELDPVLDTVLESALSLIPADDAHIFLCENGNLKFGAALFEGRHQQKPYENPRPHGLTHTVAATGKRLVVNDVSTHPIFEDRKWDGAILGLPLKIGDEVHGVMNVAFQRPHHFSSDELRVLELLADQAAIAIHNARLYEQVQSELLERKRAEQALQDSEERYRSLFEGIPVGLYTTTPEGKIIDGNPALAEMLGYPDQEALFNLDVKHLYVDSRDRTQEMDILEKDGLIQGYEMQLKRLDGTIIWVQDSTRSVKDPDGNILYYQGSLEEITDRKMMEEAVKHMATHDALTGLPNRWLFYDRINQEIARARRDGSKIAVLMLDLNNFKQVNDQLGHSVGDLVLKKIGFRMQSILRESDTIARMGGDEFLLILPGITRKDAIKQSVQRIQDVISEPISIHENTIHLKTSIGVAFFPDHGQDVDTIIKNADIAMYRGKEIGGNKYMFFQPGNDPG